MARVRKHRDKWQVLYRDPDTHKEESAGVFDKKTDANEIKKTIERDIAIGDWINPNAGKITLTEFARKWQATTTALAAKTISDYDSILRTWILPTFGDTSVRHITAMRVREWVAEMQTAGLSPRRTRKALQLLRQILNVAVEDRRIRNNPAANVKGPKVQHQERPYLEPHEIRTLADQVQERHRALILVMGVAGLRFGEAAALQRGDVDVLRGTIRVSKSVSESWHVREGEKGVGRVEVKAPKNGKARTVRIPRFLSEALNDHLQAHTPAEAAALVFPATNGALLRATNFSPQTLRPALKAAGLNEKVTAHDLRHSAAAAMIAVNPNPQLIKQQLGHGSISTTFDFYGHLFPDESDKLADALDAQWEFAANDSSRLSGPEADQNVQWLPEVGT